ncbi:D-glycero-beta-D-manno-heptose-7-phosphate kinase [Campylobacter sp.]|uniref:D-glycero-beta-D-manno-heptose-7-phosphate kinase n=1 Tax=Campylobacter sp. TaxID=205 RepID=UPI0026DCCB98|nr:D-glycero-beta-D-manno-heptose-7-phosphate kinase [Campylobacter sp.]MDO4673894.1 D-glycero-beta-D-manno-heptose-7-phosphate kinase [Campylobacter sp.]
MLEFLASKHPKILVVGDLIADIYLWCECERVSPEAPVLVAKTTKEDWRLGGGANVCANLSALGAEVFVLSVVGDDEAGEFLMANLRGKILTQKGRKTSSKSRIISHSQQVLRLDDESCEDIALEDELLQEFEAVVGDFEAVVLSDYAKGVLTPRICRELVKKARDLGLPILIDPKGSDYAKYRGATLLTPNKKEALEALKMPDLKGENLEKALRALQKNYDLTHALITLSEDGIAVYDGALSVVPARALEVYDVTGAGDSVIASLAFCLACGVSILKACEFANAAAAVVVSRIGSVAVSLEEIANFAQSAFEKKIKSQQALVKLMENRGAKRVVFTNGCFDVVHFGHISYLQKAKNLGDILIVGLNSDASVRRLKGENRPVNGEFARACMLGAFYFVDFVVLFEEDTPLELIKALRPDVLVKGGDYEGREVVGSEWAGEVRLLDFEEGFSTSGTLEKLRAEDADKTP